MLAENLVASPLPSGAGNSYSNHEHLSIQCERRQNDINHKYMSNIGNWNYFYQLNPVRASNFWPWFVWFAESKSDLADNDEDYDAASEGQLVSLLSYLLL